MYQQVQTPASSSRSHLIISLAVFFSGYLMVFWPSLARMEGIWRHSETYMHAYLILPISLWLIWRQRERLAGLPMQSTLWPALFATPFAMAWLLAYAVDVNFVSQFAAIFFLQLMIWSLLGHQILRIIWFPVVFLVFLVPFGEAANPILQQVTADMVVHFLRLVDFPIYREGLYIYTPAAVFEVAVACSGLNFLLTSLVLSCLYSYLHYSRWYKAVAFIALTLVLSIIANGIRAFLLVVIGEKSNMAYGFGADHYYYGWLVFFLVIMLAFWLGAKFADDDAPAATENKVPEQRTVPISKTTLVCLALTLLLAGSISRNIADTPTPEQPAQLVQHNQDIAGQSNWGIQFYDGLSRDHWLTEHSVELFMASYAHRQERGDMITWHNTLYQPEQWSITAQHHTGSLLNGYGILQLVNTRGQQRAVLYWYQMGEHKTSNRVAMKLLQLAALLRGDDTPGYVFAASVTGDQSIEDIRQQLLAAKQQHLVDLAP